MIYSVEELTTIADCDALLVLANLEKKQLNIRKQQQEVQYDNVSSGSLEVEAELAKVIAEIAAKQSVFAGLPEGPSKVELGKEIFRLEYKKFLLEERQERYSILSVLQREYTRACIEWEVQENQQFINAITDRKADL